MPPGPGPDVVRAAELLERLLTDRAFRADFRADPAGLCRAFGLEDLAQELAGQVSGLQTLELRESRSSLAGVMMAAAAEGVGAFELMNYVRGGGGGGGGGGMLQGQAAAVVNHALTRPAMQAVVQPVPGGQMLQPGPAGQMMQAPLMQAPASPLPVTVPAPPPVDPMAMAVPGSPAVPVQAVPGAMPIDPTQIPPGQLPVDPTQMPPGQVAAGQVLVDPTQAQPGQVVIDPSQQPPGGMAQAADGLDPHGVAQGAICPLCAAKDPSAPPIYSPCEQCGAPAPVGSPLCTTCAMGVGHPGFDPVQQGAGSQPAAGAAAQVAQPQAAPAAAAAAPPSGNAAAAAADAVTPPANGPSVAPIDPKFMDNTNAGGKLHSSEFRVRDAEGAPAPDGSRYHAAYDLFAKADSPIRAPEGGTIVEVRPSRGTSGQIFGGTVKVQTPEGRVWVFRHVTPGSLAEGTKVTAGQEIAKVSPWNDGPEHTHIELWKTFKGGYNVSNMEDPAPYLQRLYAPGGSQPIPPGGLPAGGGSVPVAPGVPSPQQIPQLISSGKLVVPDVLQGELTGTNVDPKVAGFLTQLTTNHQIGVGSVVADGQSTELVITSVDGQPVSPANVGARDLAQAIAGLDPGVRPVSVSTPWPINGPGFANDPSNVDRIQVDFAATSTAQPPPAATPATPAAPAAPPGENYGQVSAVFAAVPDGSHPAPAAGVGGSEVQPGGQQAPAPAPPAPDGTPPQQGSGGAVPPDPSQQQVPPARSPSSGAAAEFAKGLPDPTDPYPGDSASKAEVAQWMARQAKKAGIPPELPVMAGLVESGLRNINYGDADSVGFFQMRVGIWNRGEYAGYPEHAELQLKWFIDHAVALKERRLGEGLKSFGTDPMKFGEWIADVERPAAQYRGRYQLRLDEARALIFGSK